MNSIGERREKQNAMGRLATRIAYFLNRHLVLVLGILNNSGCWQMESNVGRIPSVVELMKYVRLQVVVVVDDDVVDAPAAQLIWFNFQTNKVLFVLIGRKQFFFQFLGGKGFPEKELDYPFRDGIEFPNALRFQQIVFVCFRDKYGRKGRWGDTWVGIFVESMAGGDRLRRWRTSVVLALRSPVYGGELMWIFL